MNSQVVPYSIEGKRVWVAGHRGLVGSALVKSLNGENCEVITIDKEKLDLRNQKEVDDWLEENRPHAIFVAAATVGGIHANSSRPATFLYDNIMIEANVIHGAYKVGVEKLLFLGSTCIYPKFAPQPITEGDLLTGPLEPTNQWYALAKIAGVYLCRAYRDQYNSNFISAMPTNLYGPGDYFETENGHVLPALMSKIHKAIKNNVNEVEIWGTGNPLREFLFSEDAADALVYLMKNYSGNSHINVGTGDELSIFDLACMIADVAGYKGTWKFDPRRRDGTPRKKSDSSLLKHLGWTPQTSLREGLEKTYRWFSDTQNAVEIRT